MCMPIVYKIKARVIFASIFGHSFTHSNYIQSTSHRFTDSKNTLKRISHLEILVLFFF